MNQILFANEDRYENYAKSTQVDIKKIIRFFCIALIIFGVCLAAMGIYNLVKNGSSSAKAEEEYPEILAQREEGYIVLSVTLKQGISNITYKWNNGKENVINGNGKTKVVEYIEMPEGNNTLDIVVTDVNGVITRDKREYNSNIYTGLDVEPPVVNFVVEGNDVKVTATDETEMSYLTYKWNEETETRVEVEAIGDKTIEVKVPILIENNMLTVTAYDLEGNFKVEKQRFLGTVKPKVDVIVDGASFVITATDELGLKLVVFEVNGERFNIPINSEDKLKEIRYEHPLVEGLNQIIVYAANIQEQIGQFAGQYTHQP